MFNKIISLFKNKNVLYKWIFSYAIILFIPILTSIFLYTKTDSIIEDMINSSNGTMLNNVKQVLDSRLIEAKKLSNQISFHPNINELRVNSAEELESKWHTFGKFTSNISSYTASNIFIQDFYIYLHNTDVILKPSGSTYSNYLYDSLHKSQRFTFEKWSEMLKQRHTNTFLSLPSINGNGIMTNNIAYVTSILRDGIGDPFATIVVIMEQPRFFEALKNINLDNKGTVFIIDNTDNIIASTRQIDDLNDMKYDNLSENNGQFRQKVNNEDVVLSYISSEVANWRYVSIVPQSMFWEKTEYIKRITFITILFYLILGILLAFVLAKKNYSPLADLIKRITASEGKSVNEVENEYNFIASSITSNVIENKKISEKLEQQMKTLRQNFIIRLIKGHCRNIPLNETATTYNIELYTDSFAVMVFLIEDFRKMFDGIEKDASSKDIDLVYYAIQNIVEELVNTRHSGYAADIDGMIVCLVNFKDGTKDEQKNDIFDIAKKAKHSIEKELYINLTVAIGSIETSMMKIYSSYENALEAMEHKLLNRQGEIIEYEELQNIPNDMGIYYTLDMEYQFINSIKIGDFKKSEIILREIIDGAFNASISISMARCLMFDIVSTMIKVVNELSIIYDSKFMKTLNPVENLMKCKTFYGLKDEIILILECVSEYIDVNKKSHNSDLKDKIIEYVKENYWDTNLSIAFIAEIFNMNPGYLSRFYKEQTGGSLLDFIHRTRIKQAKSLLENDNYSVSETALEVGFYDSTAFIRAFKKYEGITPGKYKDGFLN